MVTPEMIAAIFVPSSGVLVIALCFRGIREAVAARLRGGRDGNDVELTLLAEIRALRSEVYALRLEVAATGLGQSAAPPGVPAGERSALGPGARS